MRKGGCLETDTQGARVYFVVAPRERAAHLLELLQLRGVALARALSMSMGTGTVEG